MLVSDFVVMTQLWLVVGRVGVQGPGSWAWKNVQLWDWGVPEWSWRKGHADLGEQGVKEEGRDGTGSGRAGFAGLVILWPWEHIGQPEKSSLMCPFCAGKTRGDAVCHILFAGHPSSSLTIFQALHETCLIPSQPSWSGERGKIPFSRVKTLFSRSSLISTEQGA